MHSLHRTTALVLMLALTATSSVSAFTFPPPITNPTTTTTTSSSGVGSSDAGGAGGGSPTGLGATNACDALPRNTLLMNCELCPAFNGACVVYDQVYQNAGNGPKPTKRTGCDYDAKEQSFCRERFSIAPTCEHHCFGTFTTTSQFRFAVPFKAATLGAVTPRTPDDGGLKQFTTDEIPTLSNTFVQRIGALTFQEGADFGTITEISISGGRQETGTRGKMADLAVDANVVASAIKATTVALVNMNLGDTAAAAILKAVPPSVKTLDLHNTALQSLAGSAFAKTPQLETLLLSQNAFTTVSATALALPKLKTLDLASNDLSGFDASTPNLETLDLSGNNLIQIPISVFALTKLKDLKIGGNPLVVPLVLTEDQAAFLNALKFDASSLKPVPASVSTSATQGTPNKLKGGISIIVASKEVAQKTREALAMGVTAATTTTTGSQSAAPSAQPSSEGGNTTSTSSNTSDSLTTTTTTPTTTTAPGGGATTGGGGGETTSTTQPTTSTSGNNAPPPPNSGTAANSGAAQSDSPSNATLWIATGIVGGVVAVSAIVGLVIAYRPSNNRAKPVVNELSPTAAFATIESHRGSHSGILSGDSATFASKHMPFTPWWTEDELLSHRLRFSDIQDVQVISSGGGGGTVVWLVDYRRGAQQLTSKRVVRQSNRVSQLKLQRLVTEAKLAASLSHPSIVQFVGVAWTNKMDLQVLYEHMPHGNLREYLRRTAPTPVTGAATPVTTTWQSPSVKLRLAIDIVEALVYTHSFYPPLVHRNLQPETILLTSTSTNRSSSSTNSGDLKAKLSGFGCARLESENDTMTQVGAVDRGRWLAPEVLSGSTSYGTASDMYAFGVVLCAMDTHSDPFVSEAAEGDETSLLQRVARGELRPQVSTSCPLGMKEIVDACLLLNASQRPSAIQVAYMLRSLSSSEYEF